MALTAPYLIQRSPYICVTCARQLCQIRARGAPVQRRSITENWLRKTADAAKEWALQSQQIRAGKQPSLLSVLEERGYVHQIAG